MAGPKLKEGEAGVGATEVAALTAELLPKENDGVVGVDEVLVVVFTLSAVVVDPNEKLAAGGAGSTDLPKENAVSEVDVVAASPDPEFSLGATVLADGEAAPGAGASFPSSSFFSDTSDFFSKPKLNDVVFGPSGTFFSSTSLLVLEASSPKENVTFGGDAAAAANGTLLESESGVLEAPVDLFSATTESGPSVTSLFFFPASTPSFSSFFSAGAGGCPKMTSLSSKVESRSATLCPMRLLSAS